MVTKKRQSPPVAKTAALSQSRSIEASVTGCSLYAGLVGQYDWDTSVAMAIMQAESGCNPSIVSPPNSDGLSDFGLMQLHGLRILDPAQNIAQAYQIYLSRSKWDTNGWNAWSTYNNGKYLNYL